MQVIIPLAGLGTRLRPHTHTKPKPLVNVAGKPVLGHILDKLLPINPSEIIFITGYLGDQIEKYVSSHYDFTARYIEQTERLGQAHAIYLAREFVHEPVLILFVDTIVEADFTELERLDADGAVYVKEVEDPRRFGVVLLEDGVVQRLVEKPETPVSRLAITGIYYLRNWQMLFDCIKEVLQRPPTKGDEYYIADPLQMMIDRGARIVAVPIEVWEDCGEADSLLQTNRYLLRKRGAQKVKAENSIVIQPVFVAENAVIRNSIIGPYVTIGDRAQVVNSIVKDSIVNDGSYIENATLAASLVGSNATVVSRYNRLNVGDNSEVSACE